MGESLEIFSNKELITAWVAVFGALSAAAKYFIDTYRDKAAIRAAFLVEVDRLLWVIRRHRRWFGAGQMEPLIPFTTDVYDKQIENAGKLTKSLAIRIVKFYGFVKFLNQIQAQRAGYLALGLGSQFDSFYAGQLKNFEDQFAAMFDEEFRRHGIEVTDWVH